MRRRGWPVFVAVDVLTIGDEDLRALPCVDVRALVPRKATAVLYAATLRGAGAALYKEAERLDL